MPALSEFRSDHNQLENDENIRRDFSSQFINQIVAESRNGHGFVPFIGSGLSADSGILMGQDFSDYLAYTFDLVINDEDISNRWNLHKRGWPDYPSRKAMEGVKSRLRTKFNKLCGQLELEIIPDGEVLINGVQPTSGNTAQGFSTLSMLLNRPLTPSILRGTDAWKSDEQTKEVLRSLNIRNSIDGISFVPRRAFSKTSEDYIIERGIRSLHDWRATLEFLAEVTIDPANYHLRLLERDSSVIDRFNVHITRDKQCNLGHKMLAHLSRPLRIRTVLTTNFDELIETAFQRVQISLTELPVSINGGLPAASTVRAQNSLIKLHGGMAETRADFSLDQEPTNEDKKRFAEYLLGEPGKVKTVPSHLLVLGYSGNDIRCIQMIKNLLDQSKEIKVFWTCFNENDVRRLDQLFYEDEYRDQIIYYQTNRPDLLLYEMYQELALCLPSGGFAHEFTHKVPPERNWGKKEASQTSNPGSDSNSNSADRDQVAKDIAIAVTNIINPDFEKKTSSDFDQKNFLEFKYTSDGNGKCLVVNIATGAVNAMRDVFHDLTECGRHCIWLELQDYTDVRSLSQEMLRIISLRLGLFQLEHVVLNPGKNFKSDEFINHVNELVKYFGIHPNEWVFFLYGRDLPGGSAGWDNQGWNEEDYQKLQDLMTSLMSLGFSIIYVPLTEQRCKREASKKEIIDNQANIVVESFSKSNQSNDPIENPKEIEEAWEKFSGIFTADSTFPVSGDHADKVNLREAKDLQGLDIITDYENMISRVSKDWLIYQDQSPDNMKEYRKKIQFLYGTSLFRQSRHTSAFFSEAVYGCPARFNHSGIDNDWIRSQEVKNWVKDLRQKKVFYHKPGGYSWKHRDVRLGIQSLIQGVKFFEIIEDPGTRYFDFALQFRARTHYWIGDWYLRAFNATGHAIPLIESLYHRFLTAKYSCCAKPRSLNYSNHKLEIEKYQYVLFQSAVMEMIKTIKIGRPLLKFWLASTEENSIFGVDENKKHSLVYSKLKDSLEIPDSDKLDNLLMYLDTQVKSLNSSLKGEAGVLDGKQWTPPCFPEGFSTQVNEAIGSNISFAIEKVGHKVRWRIDWKKRLKNLGAEFVNEAIGDYEKRKKYDPKTLYDGFAAKKTDWIHKSSKEEGKFYRAVDVISEYAYLHVKRGKLEAHAAEETNNEKYSLLYQLKKDSEERRSRWVVATALCYFGIDACKHLHPEFWEYEAKQKIKLHTLYAISLANLNRYFEAHRHINEASALLSKCHGISQENELAIIRLRRAEVYLIESIQIKELWDFFNQKDKFLKNILRDDLKNLKKNLREEQLGFDEVYQAVPKGKELPEDVGALFKLWKKCYIARSYYQAPKKSNEDKSSGTEHPFVEPKYDIKDSTTCESHPIIVSLLFDNPDITFVNFINKIERIHTATLDDSWNALESAEQLLSGKSHSSLWWGRLLALKLRIYASHLYPQSDPKAYSSLAFRKQVKHDSWLFDIFRHGLLVAPNDPYRKLRFIDYFLKNEKDHENNLLEYQKELIDRTLKELNYNNDDNLLSEYFKEIKKRYDSA